MRKNKKISKAEMDLVKLRKKLKIVTIANLKVIAMKAAIVKCNGDMILAALLLGIGKTSLYRFREKLAQGLIH